MIKVLLLERILILSDYLKEMLDKDEEIQVIQTFTDGNEVLSYLKEQTTDVLLIDHQQTNGLVVTDEIKKRYPDVKVIGFTSTENPSDDKIMEFGACNCLSKYDATINQLITEIKNYVPIQ